MDKQKTMNKVEQLITQLTTIRTCIVDNEALKTMTDRAIDSAIQIRAEIRKA